MFLAAGAVLLIQSRDLSPPGAKGPLPVSPVTKFEV